MYQFLAAGHASPRVFSAASSEAMLFPNEAQLPVKQNPAPKLQLIINTAVRRRVAVVDDDDAIHLFLNDKLDAQGFEVISYYSGEQFLTEAESFFQKQQTFVDIILCDIRLPGIDGVALTSKIRRLFPDVPVVLMTAYGGVESAVKAIKDGAYDYLEKPFNPDRLLSILENAIKYHRLSYENRVLRHLVHTQIKLDGVACVSDSMKQIYELVKQLSLTKIPVLVAGEPGVGKKIIAKALHDNSDRAQRTFRHINCTQIVETVFESELFGQSQHILAAGTKHTGGILEETRGGTLFLEEISGIPLFLQERLLNALQEQSIFEIGSRGFSTLDVRVVVSTNKNLLSEVAEGRFNEDLYYFLSQITLQVPPLRQRQDDIPILAEYFIREFALEKGSRVKGLRKGAMNKLLLFPYKQNVTELKQIIYKCAELSEKEYLSAEDIIGSPASYKTGKTNGLDEFSKSKLVDTTFN